MRRPQTRYRKRKNKRYTRKRKLRGGSGPTKSFNFFNKYHYGDNILNLKFFYNISDILKKKGITVNYYFNTEYIKNKKEVERYVHPSGVVILHDMKYKPDGAAELWMGNDIDGVKGVDFDNYFKLFYRNILRTLGLEGEGIDTSLYQKEPYLEEIYNKLDPKYKDLDVLLINAEPRSEQIVYHKKKFEEMCIRLSKSFKVAIVMPITEPADHKIPCTMTDGLAMQDIGAISTHAKYIVGIHSGPVTTCFTDATKKSVKKWILFADNGTHHTEINNLIATKDYNMDDIEKDLKT